MMSGRTLNRIVVDCNLPDTLEPARSCTAAGGWRSALTVRPKGIADFDGGGRADLGVLRPAGGTWFILNSTTRLPIVFQWGLPGDVPVAGDYDGDGKTDLAMFRTRGAWFFLKSSTNFTTSEGLLWGVGGDIPILMRR
jgi:hypothetical protein